MDDYGLSEVSEIIRDSKTLSGKDKAEAWRELIRERNTRPARKPQPQPQPQYKPNRKPQMTVDDIVWDARLRMTRFLIVVFFLAMVVETCG